MKTLLRVLGALAFLAFLLAAGSLGYSTLKGYTSWYFRVNGDVVVNGKETSGYMHANTDKTFLMLTRTDDLDPETYLISLGPKKTVFDCGRWHPIRFVPAAVSDVNPPCPALTADATAERKKSQDPPLAPTLVRGPRFVEFSTASGKKVRGQW